MKIAIIRSFYLLVMIIFVTGCLDKTAEQQSPAQQPELEQTSLGKQPVKEREEQQTDNIDYSSVQLKLLDISEREVGTGNAIVLLFNAPIKAEQDFSRYIEIQPKLAEPILSADGKQLQYTGITPETSYQINVIAGLNAQHNSQLNEAHQQSLTTRKMPALISFKAKDGAILVPGSSEELQLYSVNVDEVDLNIYRVKQDKVARFFRDFKEIAKSKAYYYNNEYRQELVEHIYTARLQTKGTANQRHLSKFSLQDKQWANESGVYFATLAKPGAFEFNAATWFSVSSIGLQVRKFPNKTYIVTQDIKTGKLLKNIQVDLLNNKSRRIASLTTNEQGLVELANTSKLRLIVARQGEQVTVLPYNNPNFDLSDFAVGSIKHNKTQLFAYSTRDIFRPGEVMPLSILNRDYDGAVLNGLLSVKIYKPDGSRFKSLWLKAKDINNGYYEYKVKLPKNSQVGNWQAHISSKGDPRYSARFHFKVEDFIPERLRLTFNDSQPFHSFTPKQGLKLPVLGEYLYGAPAAGNKLHTRAKVNAWTQPFKQWPGYYVGDKEKAQLLEFELQPTELDENGKHQTAVKQKWSRWQSPMKVRLYYSLFESGGRALNRFYDSLLWPKASYIAVKPSFKNNQSQSNGKAHFKLLKLDKTGNVLSQGESKVELVREEERYFWSYNESNGWHYQRIAKEYVVDSRTLSFTDEQPLELTQLVEWGNYRLELTDLNSKGKTVYRFRAGEPWYNHWQSNNNKLHPKKVNLALDKASYLPGQNLQLKISAPHTGTALISIETDKLLFQKQVELTELQSTISLQVPEQLNRHDAYISAFVIAHSQQAEKSVAKRSFGITHLPLSREDRQLQVSFDVKDSWKPNQKVMVNLKVKDQQGQLIDGPAKVTLSAVDSGVLSVTNYEVQNPHPFFYGQRAYLGALTDIYEQVLEPLLADDAQLRWGGDAALTRGGDKAESEVQIVSLFSGLVEVNKGIAQIPLDIPAFDGELTLTALAFEGAKFGKAEQSVVVASPVVAQISLPKFLASNDQSLISLDMTNVTNQELQGELLVKVGGVLKEEQISKQLTLAAQQKQTLTFNLQALDKIGQGEIAVQFNSNEGPIIRNWTMPVRAKQPESYYRKAAFLMPGESLILAKDALAPLLVDSRKLQLRVGITPNLKANEHWSYLTAYPYGCLEQTTSKSRPFAAVLSGDGKKTTLQGTDVDVIQTKLQGTLARYQELQRADGSFGLWSKRSQEEHWLTAYATEFLYQLKAKGVLVPDSMLEDASNRLHSYLSSRSRHSVKKWTSSPEHYSAAYRAYAAYVLAKQANITLGPLRDVAERDLEHAQGKLPYIHLGLAMLLTGSEKEGQALLKVGLSKKRGTDYLGDYGSEVRDTAMVINLLLNHKAVPVALKKQAFALLLDLANDIEQKRWLSTQERSAILALAMTLQQQSSSKAWQGDLNIAGKLQSLIKNGEYNQNIKAIEEQEISFVNRGENAIYAAFDWAGIDKQANYKIDEGIKLTTEHYLIKDGQATQLTDKAQLASGDVVLSRVQLRSDTRVSDALLVALMPAGLELENQNLNNSLKLSTLSVDGVTVKNDVHIEHQEYRDDRYVAALDIPKQRTRTLYFLSRAVNPGRYTFPALRVESMYKPEIYGVGGDIQQLTISNVK